jgi:predicted membrane protein
MSEIKTIRKSFFEFLINLLLGVAWAVTVLGAFLGFQSFYHYGIYTALVATLFGSLFGFILVVILEVIILQINRDKEIKKQTGILENILIELKNKDEILSNH